MTSGRYRKFCNDKKLKIKDDSIKAKIVKFLKMRKGCKQVCEERLKDLVPKNMTIGREDSQIV